MPTRTIFLAGLTVGLMILTAPQAQAYYTNYYCYAISNGTITIEDYEGPDAAVIIPSAIDGVTVTAIASYATLSRATSLTIPDTVTSIGTWAFDGSTGLTNIIIGSGVTNIGSDAFPNFPPLRGVYFLGNAPAVGTNAFEHETNATAYYLAHASGWGPRLGLLPTSVGNPPFPTLGIATDSNQPVLFFPVPPVIGTNFVVQMSTNLTSGPWVTVTNASPVIGLQVTNAPGNAFFRLQ